MKRSIKVANLLSGLNTTGLEDGLELPAWAEFQNTRVSEGAAKRRPGRQRILVVPDQDDEVHKFAAGRALIVPQNDDQMTFGRFWTVEFVCEVDDVSDTAGILAFDGAINTSPMEISLLSSVLTVTLRTSDGTTTLTHDVTGRDGELMRVQVARDNLTVYLRVDGADADSDTLGDFAMIAVPGDLLIGCDYLGGSDLVGRIGFIRMLDIYLTNQKYGGAKMPDPMVAFLRWEFVPRRDETTTLRVNDRSTFRNHGYLESGAPTQSISDLQVSPVVMIEPRLDYANKGRLDIVAGGQVFLGELTR